MRAHEVRQREGGVRRAQEERTPGVEIGHALAGEIVERQKPAAVTAALKRLLEQAREELALVYLQSHHLAEFAEQRDPGVDVRGAVVAVHHRDGKPVGRCDHVNLAVYAQRFFRDDHRKIARAGRNVAGADADGVRRGHAGARVALAGGEGNAALQRAGGVKEERTALGERARPYAGRHNLRQDLAQLDSRELAEFCKHRLIIVARRAVDREHAGGLANAHQLFAGEQEMEIARERRKIGDPAHVLLAVQDRLIEVGDAPALGDIEIKERRQLFGGLAGDRVAPGAELGELIALAVKGKIAVHHRGDADRADGRKLKIELPLHVAAQRGKAVLHTDAHVLKRIGPDPVDQTVFPLPVAGSDGNVLLIDQNSLDTGRAELEPQYGFLQIQFCYLRFLRQ